LPNVTTIHNCIGGHPHTLAIAGGDQERHKLILTGARFDLKNLFG
jgi:hypothetical protein